MKPKSLTTKLRQEDGSSYAAGLMQQAADRIDELERELRDLLKQNPEDLDDHRGSE